MRAKKIKSILNESHNLSDWIKFKTMLEHGKDGEIFNVEPGAEYIKDDLNNFISVDDVDIFYEDEYYGNKVIAVFEVSIQSHKGRPEMWPEGRFVPAIKEIDFIDLALLSFENEDGLVIEDFKEDDENFNELKKFVGPTFSEFENTITKKVKDWIHSNIIK